jgi:hypothetical protein
MRLLTLSSGRTKSNSKNFLWNSFSFFCLPMLIPSWKGSFFEKLYLLGAECFLEEHYILYYQKGESLDNNFTDQYAKGLKKLENFLHFGPFGWSVHDCYEKMQAQTACQLCKIGIWHGSERRDICVRIIRRSQAIVCTSVVELPYRFGWVKWCKSGSGPNSNINANRF